MRELFIYYQVPAAAVDTARGIVEAFHSRLRDRVPGLSARLLRRPVGDKAGAPQTWMETYALANEGIDADIEALIAAEAKALDGFVVGDRHVEVFEPCAS